MPPQGLWSIQDYSLTSITGVYTTYPLPPAVQERFKCVYHQNQTNRNFIIKSYQGKWHILYQNDAFPMWFWEDDTTLSYCIYTDTFSESRNPFTLLNILERGYTAK